MYSRTDLAAIATFVLIVTAATLIAGCASPSGSEVKFTVDMREAFRYEYFDPGVEQVGIRGSIKPLSWNESFLMSDENGDTVFTATVVFPFSGIEQILDYKFKIEGGEDFWEEGRNRSVPLNGRDQDVFRVFDDPPPELEVTHTGNVIELDGFVSRYLYTGRRIFIYLPPGYNESEIVDRRYPVLYMHDGQNVFDESEAGAEWNFDEHSERLISEAGLDPYIIVAVANSRHRMTEYSPGGGPTELDKSSGDDYGRALVEELIPYINENFRTLIGPENTSLGGSSLGGLITMYLGLNYPAVFGDLLVVSPAVFFADGIILELVAESEKPEGRRIWLDMGLEEGDRMLRGSRELRDALVQEGYTLGNDLIYVEAEGASHSERAWSERGEAMLRFLFEKRR